MRNREQTMTNKRNFWGRVMDAYIEGRMREARRILDEQAAFPRRTSAPHDL